MPKNSYWLATKKFRMALKKISLSTCSIFLATSMLTGPPLLAREDSSGRGQISSEIEVAANEEVLLADPNLITAVPITAGAIMEEYHWQTADGPAKAWVTKVDISDPNIELAVIPGQGKLTERLNVTAMAKNTGAVAAINGDFFNTKGEGVPIGPMATGGSLAASPAQLVGWHALGITADRQAYIESFAFSGSVKAANGATFELAGLNKTAYWEQPGGSHSHVDKLHLYNDLWAGHTRGEDSYTTPTEILVKDSKVVKISHGEYLDIPVPKDAYILRGHGKAARFLEDNFGVGDPIDIEYAVSPDRNWSTIMGGYSLLVDGGKAVPLPKEVLASLDGVRARSAVGISKDRKTIYLVGVEGRTKASKGLRLGDLAGFFEELGVWQAINLDGGGSTTMAARPLGEWQAKRVFSPEQGANERLIVNALAVYSTAPQGKLEGLIMSGNQVALIGEGVSYSLKAYDQYFNPMDTAKLPITWTKKGEVGTLQANRFVAKRPGIVEIIAGANQVGTRLPIEVVGKGELSALNLTLAKNDEQINLGQGIPLALTLETVTGKTREIPAAFVDWQLHNLKGEVSSDGILTVQGAGSGGSGIVVARYQGFSAPLAVTVRKGVPIPLFNSLTDLSFLTYPQEVSGRIKRVADPVDAQGRQVTALDYDFTGVTDANAAAYIKLGEAGLVIDKEAESLTLDVYGSGGSEWLRAELEDAEGNSQRVDLAKRIDWQGWQSVELYFGELTNSKPLTVKRIYVVTAENEQQVRALQGRLLFKNLRLNYDREEKPVVTQPRLSLGLKEGQRQMSVNGTVTEMDVAPVIVAGRTLVPVRFVSQALNGTVLWNGNTENVTVIQKDNWIDLWLGDQQMVVNGKAISLEVPPELTSNRTMLPLRAVAEVLGLTVQWDAETRGITLSN